MDSVAVFNKRRATADFGVGQYLDTPVIKRRRYLNIIATSDGEFAVSDVHGRKVVLRVPNDPVLDEPRGMMVNAADSCFKYLPPMPGLTEEFFKHYQMTPEMNFAMSMVARSCPVANFDNPGHLLLAMRGLTGVEICKSHAAYIRALSAVLPGQADIKRLVWVHAGICKVLGSAYCATPLPAKTYPTTNHILILYELISAAVPEILKSGSGPTQEEKTEMMNALKLWHCPKYIRKVSNESKRWSFDRPRERAEAFNAALFSTQKEQSPIVV